MLEQNTPNNCDSNKFIDFYNVRKKSYFISSILILASILVIFIKGFNLGIDFAGGINIHAKSEQDIDLAKVRSILNDKGDFGEIVLQHFGSQKDISIKILASNSNSENINNVRNILNDYTKYDFSYESADFVGPQVGEYLVRSGISATILAFLSIMVYIWFRFEWQFGVGVVLALIHNIIISLGFTSMFELDFNLTTIAALLTIIGYSVNDSVVIYDRIRENIIKIGSKKLSIVINKSVKETLRRTMITSITTLVANGALIFYGVDVIQSFSLIVFVGIVVGTYSSIFLSSQMLVLFNFKKFRN
ncbi:MAG TPA: protein translocase subunit SecF [Candidatus Megaira endosymbiont of Hartmannula sinica]|nr:protein translocase subunit SecF [Candidatus Megaera endosymbiont of Hartmannula sinica]